MLDGREAVARVIECIQVKPTSRVVMVLTDTAQNDIAATRRTEIIEASRPIFVERGYVRALTKEIAAKAGVSEGTLFSIFASKEEIFLAAVLGPLESFITEMVELTGIVQELPDKKRQRVFLHRHRKMLDIMSQVWELLGLAYFSDLSLGKRYFEERFSPLFDKWVDAIEGMLEGWEHVEVSPRLVFSVVFGMHYGVSLDAAMRGESLDVEQEAYRIAQNTYYGIGGKASPTA